MFNFFVHVYARSLITCDLPEFALLSYHPLISRIDSITRARSFVSPVPVPLYWVDPGVTRISRLLFQFVSWRITISWRSRLSRSSSSVARRNKTVCKSPKSTTWKIFLLASPVLWIYDILWIPLTQLLSRWATHFSPSELPPCLPSTLPPSNVQRTI